ncbi:MAG TPA: LD-carboxypeptidase [Edaphocola sp.]|nr:LD-carboxypeptidase [Edaphocola sp.]
MQLPPFLKKGNTIAITCPSGFLDKKIALEAASHLKDWGFNVLLGDTFDKSDNYFSAKDDLRTKDLQKFLDDPNIHAILMGRGGYGMSRIIDQLDFSKFIAKPKWLWGFSDITVIHNHIQTNFGIASLHGPMCSSFTKENINKDFLKSVKAILSGESISYPVPSHPLNISGKANGILVGGNLAMLAHLSGSVSAINTKNKILFIEDIGEHLYNIDRMLYNLKRSGVFNNILGVICGGFTDTEDTTRPFGQNIYELLLYHFSDLNIPVVFDFPSGHIDENYPLCFGNLYEMNVNKKKTMVKCIF